MIEINCETDFVAKDENFLEFVKENPEENKTTQETPAVHAHTNARRVCEAL